MSEKKQNETPQVGEVDPSKNNSPILDEFVPKESDAETKGERICYFNGQKYSPGAKVCSGGRQLKCNHTAFSGGYWSTLGKC